MHQEINRFGNLLKNLDGKISRFIVYTEINQDSKKGSVSNRESCWHFCQYTLPIVWGFIPLALTIEYASLSSNRRDRIIIFIAIDKSAPVITR